MKKLVFIIAATLLLPLLAGSSAPIESSRGEFVGSKVVELYFSMPDGSVLKVPQLIAYWENGSYPTMVDEFKVDNIIEAGGKLVHIQQ